MDDTTHLRPTVPNDFGADGEAVTLTPPFQVVGIGASAGGLEAIEELLEALETNAPQRMAFVVVQHLASNHESMLVSLLSRVTSLSVHTAVDGTVVQPHCIYVIPPGADLVLEHGALRVLPRGLSRGIHLPVDRFLRSLAEDCGERSLGIVLSGTGSDGAAGLEAIKAAGGITFVQEPSTAKHDGMPRSALASGAADFCLSPAQIAAEIVSLRRRPRFSIGPRPVPHAEETGASYDALFRLIRSEYRNDLSSYKPTTIERRIERRMALNKIEKLDDYVRYVESNAPELKALYDDLLIGVTSFFRDSTPFEALKTTVFPRIVEWHKPSEPLRIWVPACATGEEAYTIAIALIEYLDESGKDVKAQIFATDVDDGAVQFARRGRYPANIALDVNEARVARFFVRTEGAYQICRRAREMVIFSTQNVLRDAPFSRLDLVSCRNLLIYLQRTAQDRVVAMFSCALGPRGFLLLGASETIGDPSHLFALVDAKNKIYEKIATAPPLAMPTPQHRAEQQPSEPHSPSANPQVHVEGDADRKLLEAFAPPAVVVDDHMRVLHFRGRTGPYLEPTPGAPSFELDRIARSELRMALKELVQRAFETQRPTAGETLLREEEEDVPVKISVVPLPVPSTDGAAHHAMIVFQKQPARPSMTAVSGADDPRLQMLVTRNEAIEHELELTRAHLQSTFQEKEAANQQLRAANEELQSSNEELQSINEELATSKEEMQSSNEELTTVNEELHGRMVELSQTNDDLHNVLAGVNNAVILADRDLRIRRFNSAAERLLELAASDGGRSIDYLQHLIDGVDLQHTVASVLESLVPAEDFVRCRGRSFVLRIAPYKTLNHEIAGAVVSLTDVDVKERPREGARPTALDAVRALALADTPLAIVDSKLRVAWTNQALCEAFGIEPAAAVGTVLTDLAPFRWTDAEVQRLFALALAGHPFDRHRIDSTAGTSLLVSAARISELPEASMLLVSIERLTARAAPPLGGTQ